MEYFFWRKSSKIVEHRLSMFPYAKISIKIDIPKCLKITLVMLFNMQLTFEELVGISHITLNCIEDAQFDSTHRVNDSSDNWGDVTLDFLHIEPWP